MWSILQKCAVLKRQKKVEISQNQGPNRLIHLAKWYGGNPKYMCLDQQSI